MPHLSTLSAARPRLSSGEPTDQGGGSRPARLQDGQRIEAPGVRSTGSGGTASTSAARSSERWISPQPECGLRRKTTAAAHASASPTSPPASARLIWSARRSAGVGRALRARRPRGAQPPGRRRRSSPRAPTKLASGTPRSSRRLRRGRGARAAPAITPATIPTKESICAARPRRTPRRRRRGPRGRGGCSRHRARPEPSGTGRGDGLGVAICRDRRPVEVGTSVPVSRLRIGERGLGRSRATVDLTDRPCPGGDAARHRSRLDLIEPPAHRRIASASSSSSYREYASATAMSI